MGVTFRFLATVGEAAIVLDWFRTLPEQPVENVSETRSLFYFRSFGSLESVAAKSPLVSVFLPVQKRGVLTTIGEVHFLATPLSAFPGLNKIKKKFQNWIEQYSRVFSRDSDFEREWDYFLEGSIQNWDPDVFALPAGMIALRNGSYFVMADDNDHQLNLVCRKLELRGVEGISR